MGNYGETDEEKVLKGDYIYFFQFVNLPLKGPSDLKPLL